MLCIVIVDESSAARYGVAKVIEDMPDVAPATSIAGPARQCGQDAFLLALRMARNGGFQLSPQLTDLIRAAVDSQPQSSQPLRLSRREQDTLSFISRGFTHQQTATRMGVSKATVDSYVARVRAKLKLGNKAELTLAALRYVEG